MMTVKRAEEIKQKEIAVLELNKRICDVMKKNGHSKT